MKDDKIYIIDLEIRIILIGNVTDIIYYMTLKQN